ncbi:hypothetical protein [Methylobacterium nodulans]|uniref:Uncharacterized protein n=1 Tax=Methylobacterium nodulans (strain LMG 21967 / CNCM I-2342 / ORS 2060) TaxID=460265 RepID=B8INS8_METNO|nr:hypothetical protein [Methylobacterium nodulans]ACL58444.1 hypothetical protein Mnod_3534 [Methylobacterium nodulans ORS 2060]
MNRRSLLAMLGLAPVAAPVALATAKQAVHETVLHSSIQNLTVTGWAPGHSDTVIDGPRIGCGSITADRIRAEHIGAAEIPAGSISISKLRVETPIDPFCTGQDRLIGALSFGA